MAVDNLPHTWVSEKHLAAWRMWLVHTFYGRGVPKVEIEAERSGNNLKIKADVNSETPIEGVKLYYAYNPKTDWRSATWFSVPMKNQDNQYSAELDKKERENLAYYVEVEDRGREGNGYISSLVEIVN